MTTDTVVCPSCKGEGVVYHAADGDGLADDTCPTCNGSGEVKE